jgi:hypothetical protein
MFQQLFVNRLQHSVFRHTLDLGWYSSFFVFSVGILHHMIYCNRQTGVIAVNHVMEDPDGEHEKGAVPTQVQSMAENTVLEPIKIWV